MGVEQNGWVKFHRQALRPESSLMKLDKSAQLAFLKYVMLARWQEPYRGCLCDLDGKPWPREQRAVALQVGYSTAQRVETAMIEAGLVIIDKRGRTSHHNSRGRLRIMNYDAFQQPSETEDATPAENAQPPKPEVPTFSNGGCQPPETEDDTLNNPTFPNGGLEAGTPTGAGAGGEDTSEETTSRDGGCDSQEVNDVKKLRSNGLNNLAADAAGSENSPTLFPDDTPEPPAPEKPNETDVQRVIRECWEMLDLGNMPDGKLKGYSRLTQLFVADGWEVIEQQVKMCFATKPQPTGNANPWAFFCKQFRLAVNQPWGFGVQKDSARGTSGNQGPGVWEPGDFSTAPTGEIDLSTMTGSHDNR